jgi:cycloartenol synthase
MKMQGYNGSQLWDTAFTALALMENRHMSERYQASLVNAYKYFDTVQIREDAPLGDKFYRHINKGAYVAHFLVHRPFQ